MNSPFALCAALLLSSFYVISVQASESPLVQAAEAADWPLVQRLISDGSPVDQAQPDGMTALHWAVFHNHKQTVQCLIDAKSDVNAATRYQVTPLTIACEIGNDSIATLLLGAGADVKHKLPGGVTPLMIAARSGNEEIVRALLKNGANANATERRDQTALMWAAAEGNVQAVEVLIESGCDLNASAKSGFTAMMFAAREGKANVIEKLIASGVDVSAVIASNSKQKRSPRQGTSALTLAVESGHFELAMQLVEYGADPNDQRSGFAPLHSLSWIRKPNRGEEPDGDPPPRGSGKLTSLQFVRALVAAGADVNARLKRGKSGKAVLNHRGATPFLLAAKTADVPLLKLLIELGADPTIPNVDGTTPLMAAAGVGVRAVGEEAGTESEVIEAIEFLLQHGNEVNVVDKNRETPMHGAAYRNFPRVVEFLAKHGSDSTTWNHKNVSGWTPVMIAQGHRPGSFKPSPETVAALQSAMKDNAHP